MNDILYTNYKNVRNLVWKILIRYKITNFPLDISALAHKLNIQIHEVAYLPKNIYALSYNDNGNKYIDFISRNNVDTDRFTLAHELGHILLHHNSKDGFTQYQEEQANIFAARLLAPMIVIRKCDPKSSYELSDIFGMSPESASIRFNRYLEIKKRNKFLTNSLEREYYTLYTKSKAN